MRKPISSGVQLLPQFIAVTGQEASGKDSYGEHLSQVGYMHVPAGDVLREWARDLGYTDPIPRSVLSHIGDEMKKKFGLSPIISSTLKRYELEQKQFPAGLVICGLRRIGELITFKENGAVLLWIDADAERRFNNQNLRARGDHQTREEFLARSKKEYFGDTDGGKDGVNLQAVEALANCRVVNDGSLEELFNKADQALAKLANK